MTGQAYEDLTSKRVWAVLSFVCMQSKRLLSENDYRDVTYGIAEILSGAEDDIIHRQFLRIMDIVESELGIVLKEQIDAKVQ